MPIIFCQFCFFVSNVCKRFVDSDDDVAIAKTTQLRVGSTHERFKTHLVMVANENYFASGGASKRARYISMTNENLKLFTIFSTDELAFLKAWSLTYNTEVLGESKAIECATLTKDEIEVQFLKLILSIATSLDRIGL